MKTIFNLLIFIFIFFLQTVCTFSSEKKSIDSHSLTLRQAIGIGLQNNYDFMNAELDLDRARSERREQEDEYSMRLNTSMISAFNRSENESSDFSTEDYEHNINLELERKFMVTGGSVSLFSTLNYNDFDDSSTLFDSQKDYDHSYGIRFHQPLLKGAGFHVNRIPVQRSRISQKNARYDVELSRRSLIARIIRLYYGAVKADRLIDITKLAVKEARTHVQQTQVKLEEGLVAQIDVSQAELQLSRQENSIVNARQNYENAMDSLSAELGIDFSENIKLEAKIIYEPEMLDMDELIAEALKHRLEISKTQNRLIQYDLNILTSSNNRLPSLNLSLETAIDSDGQRLQDSFDDDDREYRVEMGLSYTFGDRTWREKYLRNLISKHRLKNEFSALKDDIKLEVKQSVRRYNSLKKSIEILENAVDLAEYTLSLSNQSYTAGLIRNTDLLKAQDDLLRTQTEYLSTLMDFEIAIADVLLTIGRPIEPDNLRIHIDSTLKHSGETDK